MLWLKAFIACWIIVWGANASAFGASWLEKLSIMGVIASEVEGQSVVLLKGPKGKIFARKSGQTVGSGFKLTDVTRKYVQFESNGEVYRIKTGATSKLVKVTGSRPAPAAVADSTGIDHQGGEVRIAEDFRDHILKDKLSEVLMQAAAIPYYVNGSLQGFGLHDIDEGSIYRQIGLENGDIVTAINGIEITDVGSTISLLHKLKDETKAEVALLRGGQSKTIKLVIK